MLRDAINALHEETQFPVEMIGHTSVGSVAMQIRVAATTLGLDPGTLTTRDQLELATCPLNNFAYYRATLARAC